MNDLVMQKQLERDAIDLMQPSLRALSYLLHHQELWPVLVPGFEWSFSHLCDCGDGLYRRMWGSWLSNSEPGIDYRQVFSIGAYAPTPSWRVTPEMVAARIDEHLASGRYARAVEKRT